MRSASAAEGVRLSVVVPVFNSEATIDELASRIGAVCRQCAAEWELVLVNDGSADGTWERIVAIAGSDPDARGIDLIRNYGQHNALLAGIESARFELVVTLDDDLQNPPEEIPVLLEALSPGVDLVYGTPARRHHGRVRRVGTAAVRRLANALSAGRIPLEVSSFRAFRSRLRGAPGGGREGARVSLDSQLCRSARRVTAVEVRHDPRLHGDSNYTFGKLARHAATVLASSLGQAPRRRTGEPSYVVRLRTPSPEGDGLRG